MLCVLDETLSLDPWGDGLLLGLSCEIGIFDEFCCTFVALSSVLDCLFPFLKFWLFPSSLGGFLLFSLFGPTLIMMLHAILFSREEPLLLGVSEDLVALLFSKGRLLSVRSSSCGGPKKSPDDIHPSSVDIHVKSFLKTKGATKFGVLDSDSSSFELFGSAVVN